MADNESISLSPACPAGVDTRRRVIRLEQDSGEQWDAINHLRNRLPTWATIVISVLTFLLGCSCTYAAMLAQ